MASPRPSKAPGDSQGPSGAFSVVSFERGGHSATRGGRDTEEGLRMWGSGGHGSLSRRGRLNFDAQIFLHATPKYTSKTAQHPQKEAQPSHPPPSISLAAHPTSPCCCCSLLILPLLLGCALLRTHEGAALSLLSTALRVAPRGIVASSSFVMVVVAAAGPRCSRRSRCSRCSSISRALPSRRPRERRELRHSQLATDRQGGDWLIVANRGSTSGFSPSRSSAGNRRIFLRRSTTAPAPFEQPGTAIVHVALVVVTIRTA